MYVFLFALAYLAFKPLDNVLRQRDRLHHCPKPTMQMNI